MKTKYLLSLLSAALFFLTAAHPASAVNGDHEVDAEGQLDKAASESQEDVWEYVLQGRPDPFRTFIKEIKTHGSEPAPAPGPDLWKPVTPMQRFEPGQLSLVAIMFLGTKKVAMVEDDTGRGYPIYEGMLVGRYGVVDRIQDNEVLILETRITTAQENKVSTYVMRLKNEGE